MKNILTVKNLAKEFKKERVVNRISFNLKQGEILGFLGPNGAGKTTTIQMLMGALKPTSGEIKYFGTDFIKNKSQILERLNFSSTYTSFPSDLTTYEILRYTSFFYNISNREKRINETLKLLNIEKLKYRRARNLSEGQKTKVNLAKAFLNKPDILLLDEPTASLDPRSAKFMRDFIIKQQKNNGLSVLFTSHNMPEVEEICDRVIFINHGKIIDNASPSEIARRINTIALTLRLKNVDITCASKALDSIYEGTYNRTKIKQWNKELGTVYNRGFSHGFYLGKPIVEWSGIYGNKATKQRVFVGTVKKFFSKAVVAEILLEAGELSNTDEFQISGDTTRIIRGKKHEIWFEEKSVPKAGKGSLVTMKLDNKVRSGDRVYRIDKTS